MVNYFCLISEKWETDSSFMENPFLVSSEFKGSRISSLLRS